MKINQIIGLNRKARTFLLENCISKRGVEVMVFGFIGYINGEYVENITLIRKFGSWERFDTKEQILSISGKAETFNMTRNTIL